MDDMGGMKTKECNKRAIVAGGAGFVGCHLCRRLLAEGYAVVTCVDNFQTGNPDNIARFRSEGRFRLVARSTISPAPRPRCTTKGIRCTRSRHPSSEA